MPSRLYILSLLTNGTVRRIPSTSSAPTRWIPMAAIARPHPAPAPVRLAAVLQLPPLFALLILGTHHRTEARITSSTYLFDLPPPSPPSRHQPHPPPPPPPPSPPPPSHPYVPHYLYGYNFNIATAAGIIGGIAFVFLSCGAWALISLCTSYDPSDGRAEGEDENARRMNETIGVDLEVFDAFPTMTYAKARELDSGGGNDALECPVCLAEFSDDDALRLIPICRHVFHVKCIDTWLESHVTCPVCRCNLSVQPESAAAQLPASTAASTENTASTGDSADDGGLEAAGFPLRPVVIQRWNSTGHEAVERYGTLQRQPDGVQLDILATPMHRRGSKMEEGMARSAELGGGGPCCTNPRLQASRQECKFER